MWLSPHIKFTYNPLSQVNLQRWFVRKFFKFLAIVHALALYKSRGLDWPLYSDSRNAILWVKAGKCRTKLERNAGTEAV